MTKDLRDYKSIMTDNKKDIGFSNVFFIISYLQNHRQYQGVHWLWLVAYSYCIAN